jgi:dual specificity MAP kinase phosphatase
VGSSSSSGGGRVLVHCSQGVSRSTTIAIAYLMWKTRGSYDEVYQAVRALRGVTSPNVGFMCQLINWAVSFGGKMRWLRPHMGCCV